MPKLFCLLLTTSAVALAGCAGSFEYTPRKLSDAKWSAASVSLTVEDQRQLASTKLPRVPALTMGGGGETNDMRLPPEFSEFARWRLSQLLTRSGPRLRLIVVPESVRAGWSASLWAETEKASVVLAFRVTTEDGSRVLLEGRGEGREEFSSTDASDSELAQVFRAACNNAFDSFFASASTIRQLNVLAARAAAGEAFESNPVARAGTRARENAQ